MKRYFITGLALLLPAVLTLVIVGFLVNLLTDPFVNLIEGIINQIPGGQNWSLNKSPFLRLTVRLLVLFTIFLFIIFIGFLTRSFFMHTLFTFTDRLIHRIPGINKVYKAIQEVIHTLFSAESSSFKQVVLVPYPFSGSLSLGFTTTNVVSKSEHPKIRGKIPVFVPGTPNPTFGFILLFPQEEVIFIDMKVEEAFKLLVSCGIMLPPTSGKGHG